MMTQSDSVEHRLRLILVDVLGLTLARAEGLHAQSGLFGALPELDSMAVAGLLTEIEDQFHIIVDDEEVNGDMLETFGGLSTYVTAKLAR